ncbi:MAG: deoxyribodipyrimidine photo-lyase [Anaerolineales bacterium]|nr:deoxyribodipyrimidine photo-lyase [Anaerolineales bacterium]
MGTTLWWIRRDLRLADNQALAAALAQSAHVLPVYVLDPHILESAHVGPTRVAFLFGGLRQLDAQLRGCGSRLVVRCGIPADELAKLVTEAGADAVFAEEDFSPYARERDAQVRQRLQNSTGRSVPLELRGRPTVQPPQAMLKDDGTPYVVFTPFSRRWKALPRPDAGTLERPPQHISTPSGVASLPLPDAPTGAAAAPFPPGEAEARRRLTEFAEGATPAIYRYAQERDRLALPATSLLSPYLRFGMLSARQAAVTAFEAIAQAPDGEARRSAAVWLDELIWREFYVSVLYHFPEVRQHSFRPQYREMAWDNNEAAFDAWCEGRTGYPLVDAGMRQLRATGWMHNRARMVVASFLTKILLIDWRWGEQYFMQQLVDGDPAANNGGWQWSAGTGTDAAPYFRIFSPTAQGQRHDPDGAYVRRWVPELQGVPAGFVHEPWKMDRDAQRATGCTVGVDYPERLISYAAARERTLRAYRAARDSFAQAHPD